MKAIILDYSTGQVYVFDISYLNYDRDTDIKFEDLQQYEELQYLNENECSWMISSDIKINFL